MYNVVGNHILIWPCSFQWQFHPAISTDYCVYLITWRRANYLALYYALRIASTSTRRYLFSILTFTKADIYIYWVNWLTEWLTCTQVRHCKLLKMIKETCWNWASIYSYVHIQISHMIQMHTVESVLQILLQSGTRTRATDFSLTVARYELIVSGSLESWLICWVSFTIN